MFKIKTLTALVTSLLTLASFASAQYGLPDFTNFDFSGYMQQQYNMTTNMINGQMSGILQQRGPEIQAAYQQCLYSGGYCGSFEEYALQYVSTNGFSDGGAWAMTQRGMQQKEYEVWQGVKQAEANSAAAINGWNSNYYENQGEMGNILMGTSSWIDPKTGSNYTLPYNIQANTSWYDNGTGNTFYYDTENNPAGQYYILSPDGSWWMPLNPWQTGQ